MLFALAYMRYLMGISLFGSAVGGVFFSNLLEMHNEFFALIFALLGVIFELPKKLAMDEIANKSKD